MTIKELQKHVGTEPDGQWGPNSKDACQQHLRRLMPKPHPFPTQAFVRSGASIFGKQGVKGGYTPPMKSFTPPYPIFLYGNRSQRVEKITAHAKVADSLEIILTDLRGMATPQEIAAFGMDSYFGCYNPRAIRGGTAASMHSWAIAVDFDANRNGLHTPWPARAPMSIWVIELFARQGWLSAGAFWGHDAMHFQATQ